MTLASDYDELMDAAMTQVSLGCCIILHRFLANEKGMTEQTEITEQTELAWLLPFRVSRYFRLLRHHSSAIRHYGAKNVSVFPVVLRFFLSWAVML